MKINFIQDRKKEDEIFSFDINKINIEEKNEWNSFSTSPMSENNKKWNSFSASPK